MPEPIKIQVTQEDIDRGVALNCDACPIALAVQRVVGSVGFAGPIDIRTTATVWYRTPEHVIKWMMAFDQGKDVEPFEFELTEDMRR